MLRRLVFSALAAALVMMATSPPVHAWGAYHAGLTFGGYGNVYHLGYVRGYGGYGGWGGYRAGYGGFGWGGYGGYGYRYGYAYAPSYYGGTYVHGTYYLR